MSRKASESPSSKIPTEGEAEPFGKDESVQQCLEVMSGVLAEQRARARHLDTKTGTVAGFCAAALVLNVTLGRSLLEEELGPQANVWIQWLFGGGVLALALASLFAVLGVLRPMGHDDLTAEQIDQYSDRPKVVTPAEDLRMTWLRTVTCMAISDRSTGSEKSRRSTGAVVMLGIGVLAIAGQAVTLLIAR